MVSDVRADIDEGAAFGKQPLQILQFLLLIELAATVISLDRVVLHVDAETHPRIVHQSVNDGHVMRAERFAEFDLGEDAFDVGVVAEWLRDHAADPTGLDAVPAVKQFSGGASNLTYLLTYPTREVILRRAPGGTKAKGAHDMGREYRIQSKLSTVLPYIAPMIAFCDDHSVLGSEFYAMGKIDGIIAGKEFPPDVTLSAEQAREMCLNFIDVLVELHSVDPEKAGPSFLGSGASVRR